LRAVGVGGQPIRLLGETNAARLAKALPPGGGIDAVAHQVLHDVAEMNADPELDAALGRHAGVSLGHAVLNFDGAVHRVDNAAKFDERAVAGALAGARMSSWLILSSRPHAFVHGTSTRLIGSGR
jgi:hypothetical protein